MSCRPAVVGLSARGVHATILNMEKSVGRVTLRISCICMYPRCILLSIVGLIVLYQCHLFYYLYFYLLIIRQ